VRNFNQQTDVDDIPASDDAKYLDGGQDPSDLPPMAFPMLDMKPTMPTPSNKPISPEISHLDFEPGTGDIDGPGNGDNGLSGPEL
jgi:hypothetical protein